MSLAHKYVGGPGISAKDAGLVGSVLQEIERKHGRLSTAEVADKLVEVSRPPDSKTHHLFGDLWDPKKAQRVALLDRATTIIRSVLVVFEDRPKVKVRQFPVLVHKGKRGPVAMNKVLEDRDLTAALVESAKQEAKQWADRYARLCKVAELSPIFDAIKKVIA